MQISQGNGHFNIAQPYENSPTGGRKEVHRERTREGKKRREPAYKKGERMGKNMIVFFRDERGYTSFSLSPNTTSIESALRVIHADEKRGKKRNILSTMTINTDISLIRIYPRVTPIMHARASKRAQGGEGGEGSGDRARMHECSGMHAHYPSNVFPCTSFKGC